jgi:hypothetical protein
MKYIILFLACLYLFISCNNNEIKKQNDYNMNNEKANVVNKNIQKNLIGVWNWRSNDKTQEFTIKIKKIDKDSVFGQYCAVYNNGNKLDCDLDDINNIKGLIIKDKIQLDCSSFFGAKNGKAEIKFYEDHIEWKITKSPKGEYYSPELATLYKKNQNETRSNKTNLSRKRVKLPFDFEKYMDLCYLEKNTLCNEKFPFYKSDELPLIVNLINSKINKNIPDRIYCIETGLDFETYVFQIKDESKEYLLTLVLMTVNGDKIISNQLIGQGADGESPEDVVNKTFVINKDLSVYIFDKLYGKKDKLSMKYVINNDWNNTT